MRHHSKQPFSYETAVFATVTLILIGIAFAPFDIGGYRLLADLILFAVATTWIVRAFFHKKFWVFSVMEPRGIFYFLGSVFETTHFNSQFDKLKHHKILDLLCELGTVAGFGAVGVDFFWGSKLKKKSHRVLLFIISVIILGWLFGFLLNTNPLGNPLAKGDAVFYQFFFGLFGLAGFLIYALFAQALDILVKTFSGVRACPGVAPVLPGIQTPNVPIFIPVEAWLSILAILIIHEASHGFLSRRHNVPVESSGLLLFGILPIGAFVKPDEKKLGEINHKNQVRVYSAGPTSNLVSMIIVAILAIAIAGFIINPTLGAAIDKNNRDATLSVQITKIEKEFDLCGEKYPSPAYGALDENSTIVKINDKPIATLSDALNALRSNPSEPKTFLLQKNGQVTQKTLSPNALGRFGINVKAIQNPQHTTSLSLKIESYAYGFVSSVTFWFVFLSFLVAIANFMPFGPIDGGRMVVLLCQPYFGWLNMNEQQTQTFIRRLFYWILIPLILINALPIIL
ncbi:MAG: site-2 protease family protein [Candidatus Micrarchaeota archaeon]